MNFKNIIVAFIIISLTQINFTIASEVSTPCCIGKFSFSFEPGDGSVQTFVIDKVFDNAAEAASYADSLNYTDRRPTTGHYSEDIATSFEANSTFWNEFRVKEITNINGSGIHHCIVYPDTDYILCACDSDGDGMPDEADISPDDDSCPLWFVEREVIDTDNGNCHLYAEVRTSNGDFIDFGDLSAVAKAIDSGLNVVAIKHHFEGVFPAQNTCDTLQSYFSACNGTFFATSEYDETEETPETTVIEDGKLVQNEELETGQDSTTNTTDSENLSTIADNTSSIVNNQQNISDQITEIANQIALDRYNNQNDSNSRSVRRIDDNVQKVIDHVNDLNNNSSTAYSELQNDLLNPDTERIRSESSFTESDEYSAELDSMIHEISEDGKLTGVIDKYAENEVLNGFKTSHVSIHDQACSVNIPFSAFNRTTNIEISACEFEAELTIIGNVLYVVCMIACWIKIFRGR